jgi:exodeoxyribonuclease VII large subunit
VSGREPPDWALPGWDAVDPASAAREPVTRESARPRGTFGVRVLGVSEVTRVVRDALRSDPRLTELWVEGEVGRVSISSAGHAYFTLKDARSQLACVFFRDDRMASPFEPRTGLQVLVHGRIDIFDAQGVYQLYVSAIQPSGFGDLALRFEQTKAKLAAEGLFAADRKRPLPGRPATIGVVTSLSGAVLHDIRRVLARRWPLTRVVVAACLVQGDGAVPTIVAALDRLARFGADRAAAGRPEEAPAVVIVARGGGSLEDLWSFNDERVVRAVAAHPVPVVSGVGHETDVTLADFAADVRAPTPSAAAELVVPDRGEVTAGLRARRARLDRVVAAELARVRRHVGGERRALDGLHPAARLAASRERAGYLLDRATAAAAGELAARRRAAERAAARLAPLAETRTRRERARLGAATAALGALGPDATLARGYAIVRRGPDGLIVRAPAQVPAGTGLLIRLAHGDLAAHSDGAAHSSGAAHSHGEA